MFVTRTCRCLIGLIGSDADMAAMCLTKKALGSDVSDHVEVELMLEVFATEIEDLKDRISHLQYKCEHQKELEGRYKSITDGGKEIGGIGGGLGERTGNRPDRCPGNWSRMARRPHWSLPMADI